MTLDDLQTRRVRMIDYLKLKVEEADWHGVADAAMDLREIEAQIKVIGPYQAHADNCEYWHEEQQQVMKVHA